MTCNEFSKLTAKEQKNLPSHILEIRHIKNRNRALFIAGAVNVI